ncbi:MAG: NHL repeat-containing protein [bacterium]|nr:NHL repeat-containing protein [bacterium]
MKKIFPLFMIFISLILIFNSCTPVKPLPSDSPQAILKKEVERKLKNVKVIQLVDKSNRPFSEPKSMAFTPDNYMMITESGMNKVQRHDSEGNYLNEFKINFKEKDYISFPEGIIYSPDKHFFLCDSSNSRILKIDTKGEVVKELKSNDPTGIFLESDLNTGEGLNINMPSGITVSPRGEIFVADTYNNRIIQIDLSGKQVWSFGDTKSSKGALFRPRDIAADKIGNLYVTDDTNQIKKISIKKGLIKTFGSEGKSPGQFMKPKGIAIWNDLFLVICDSMNGRIQFFTKDGDFITSVEKFGKTNLASPYGVETDDFGNLYIIDKQLSVLIKVYEF